MNSKINERAWAIIALFCAASFAYMLTVKGLGDQDVLVLLGATLIAAAMYGYRRWGRIKEEKHKSL